MINIISLKDILISNTIINLSSILIHNIIFIKNKGIQNYNYKLFS